MNLASWHENRLGHNERARELGEAALALFRDVDNRDGIAHALDTLGDLAYQTGRYTDAVSCYEEALALSREVGHAYLEADILDHLAFTYTALGQHDRARTTWRQAYDRYEAQHRTAERNRTRQHLDELDGNPMP